MATCEYCGTTILFGGVREGELRFCNDKCREAGQVAVVSQHIPPDILARKVAEIHQGPCPVCGGRGPVDVHTSHKIWSALVITHWSSDPQVCCRSCGRKSQFNSLLFSLLLGWWGIPHGLIMTPVQVGRNLAGLWGGPAPDKPSEQLIKLVRLSLAAQVLLAREAEKSPAASGAPPVIRG
jgi:hypothetical protein